MQRPGLHEHVAQCHRLGRAGDDGQAAGIRGELAQQRIARSAANDVNGAHTGDEGTSVTTTTVTFLAIGQPNRIPTPPDVLSYDAWLKLARHH